MMGRRLATVGWSAMLLVGLGPSSCFELPPPLVLPDPVDVDAGQDVAPGDTGGDGTGDPADAAHDAETAPPGACQTYLAADGSCPAIDGVVTNGEGTCVRMSTGDVWCWSPYGESGNFEPEVGPATPVLLPGPAIQLVSGDRHFCALLATGAVMCWGPSTFGVLGVPTNLGGQPEPVVAQIEDVATLYAGWRSTCAVHSDRSLSCWGRLSDGQSGYATLLGPGTYAWRPYPIPLPAGSEVLDVAIGGSHKCAVVAPGDLWCWGSNEYGELLDLAPTPTPTRLFEGFTVEHVAAGVITTAVSLDGGKLVWGWGGSSSGTLGFVGSPNNSPVALDPLLAGQVANMHGGDRRLCFLLGDGSAQCLGSGTNNALGVFGLTTATEPVTLFAEPAVRLLAHQDAVCLVDTLQRLWCMGLGYTSSVNPNAPLQRRLAW